MNNNEHQIKFTAEAPKWTKLPSFIKDVAFGLGLRLEIEVERGWIRENIRATVYGDRVSLLRFCKQYNEDIEKHESR